MGSNIITALNCGENVVTDRKGNTLSFEEASLPLLPPKIPHRVDKTR
jgi:hypothetical protein